MLDSNFIFIFYFSEFFVKSFQKPKDISFGGHSHSFFPIPGSSYSMAEPDSGDESTVERESLLVNPPRWGEYGPEDTIRLYFMINYKADFNLESIIIPFVRRNIVCRSLHNECHDS